MEDRRAVLTKALKVAGLVMSGPFLGAATPYVRLEAEQGDIADERRRFGHEIAAVNAQLLLQPALQTQPALLALWANLHQFRRTAHVHVFDLRAWTAILASVNAVTLTDQSSAAAWLQQAHRFARLDGDPNLISLAHSKAANAGMYFGVEPNNLLTDAKLALHYATTKERQGMALAMYARAAAKAGLLNEAVRAGQRAIALADDSTSPAPRMDAWMLGQAHMTISRALADYPVARPAVEEHVSQALRARPKAGTLWRAQPLLNIADVRARDGELYGSAEVLTEVLGEMTPLRLQPSLAKRIYDIITFAEERHPRSDAMSEPYQRFAELISS